MNANIPKNGRYCRVCGRKKIFQNFCIFCFRSTSTDIHIFLSDQLCVRDSIRLEIRKNGIKRFIYQVVNGWFSSVSKKIKDGVDKIRIIDREKKRYYEHVEDHKTGKQLRHCEEDLRDHKPSFLKKSKISVLRKIKNYFFT